MRATICWISAVLICNSCLGQQLSKAEAVIRMQEQRVVQAILNADTLSLRRLWSPDFLVNNPRNNVTQSLDSVLIIQKSGMIDYSLFERIVERIQVQKQIAITMGHEFFISRKDIPGARAGQKIERRFTNVWQKKRGQWIQIARHASIICK